MPIKPRRFSDLIGQENVVSLLRDEAKTKQPAHTLLYGPPGLGKTTIAECMANEAGLTLLALQCGPTLTIRGITKMLMDLDRTGYTRDGRRGPNAKRYLIFLDEVSELQDTTFLHSVLSSWELNPDPYGGVSWLPDLTMFACTNWPHQLSEPFKSRFPIKLRVEPYSELHLEQMIARSYPRLKASEVQDIAGRSRGQARMALDYAALVERHGFRIFDSQGIDKDGLKPIDRQYLDAMSKANRPLSLSTISAMIQEDMNVVRKEVEPYLLRLGRIEITSKGRQLVGTAEGMSFGRRVVTADPCGQAEAYVEG